MAKQPTFVRVKYVVDSTDLNKARQASVQAQKATDDLRNSAQRTGQAISQANQQSVRSIENMTQSLARLKAQIQLTTDPKKLQQLSIQYKQLKTDLDAANKKYLELDKSIKQVNASQQAASLTIGQLTTAVKAFLVAGLLQQTVKTALEMAKLAGQVEGVKRAFDRLPGSIVLLEDLRRATQGSVTDFELMQRSLQARNFRIPLNQLANLFEFATVRAQQTGQSVDYLINSIVFGLGFQSIRRLDNVGISAAELRDVMKELGVSLNEAFNIVVQREIEKMGGLIKTAATEAEIFNARIQELQQALAKNITDKGFLAFINEQLKLLKTAVDAFPVQKWILMLNPFTGPSQWREFNKGVEEAFRHQRNLENATNDLKAIMDGLPKTQREQTVALIDEIIQRKEQIRYGEHLLRQKAAEAKLNELQNSNTSGYQRFLENRDRINHEIRAIGNSLEVNRIIALELAKVLGSITQETVNQLGLIEAKEKEIEDIGQAIQAAKSTQEIHDLNLELAKLEGQLADLKAFGTTKQQLIVAGQLKLVPVIDPKGFNDSIKQNPLFKKNINPVTKEFLEIDGKIVVRELDTTNLKFDQTREATDQLEEDVTLMINNMMLQMKLFGESMVIKPKVITPKDEWDKLSDGWEAVQEEAQDFALEATANRILQEYDLEVQALDMKIQAKRDFYDEQQILAGDNERYKSQLRLREEREIRELQRKRADREKDAAKAGVLVNTALGIIKVYAGDGDFYEKLFRAALVAAEGVAQYQAVSRARYYAKGEVNIDGPGTKTSDSIQANLSKGESVINADSTQRSLKLLEGINAGKIDDRILDKLHLSREGVKVIQSDNTDIIKAIKSQKQPDVFRIGSEVYEKKKSDDGFSAEIKRRTMSN